jgi:hypothetical protein
MCDRTSTKKPVDHAKKIVALTLNSKEEMRDEAYVQVLKQMKNHKDPNKTLKGWNFLAILASSYAPSERLYYSILNFLFFEIKNNNDPNIVNRANYIFARLFKTFTSKRKNIPSDNEISHIEQLTPIYIPVHFFSNSSVYNAVESYTTVRELKNMVMKELNFSSNRGPYFGIYEVCNKKNQVEERFIDDSEKICDVMSLWDKEIEESLKNKEQVEFKLYLKIFIHYNYTETDNDTITIVFTQSVYDVINGKYILKEQDIVTLAALQLLVNYSNNQDLAFQNLQKNLDKYVPFIHINLNPSVYWVEKIMDLFSKLKSSSKLESKLTYIEHLRTSPLWEAHQFSAKVKL